MHACVTHLCISDQMLEKCALKWRTPLFTWLVGKLGQSPSIIPLIISLDYPLPLRVRSPWFELREAIPVSCVPLRVHLKGFVALGKSYSPQWFCPLLRKDTLGLEKRRLCWGDRAVFWNLKLFWEAELGGVRMMNLPTMCRSSSPCGGAPAAARSQRRHVWGSRGRCQDRSAAAGLRGCTSCPWPWHCSSLPLPGAFRLEFASGEQGALTPVIASCLRCCYFKHVRAGGLTQLTPKVSSEPGIPQS